MKKTNNNSMYLFKIEETEVINIVKACKSKTSNDYNRLSMSIVKSVIEYIIKPFTHICNRSFEQGIFPDNMKIAKVIPLFKSGDKNVFTNYRPVSLLPQFSKILEKLFNKRLDNFIEKYKLLIESQYGFRSKRSTALAILELLEEITNASVNREFTIGIFVDLKKAFDTIDHNLLSKKLEFYGIRGIANDWIKSYLYKRKQYVQIDDFSSDYQEVVCGVPQGSILGPKLFILYINDICNVSSLFKYILFADDTNLFCSGKDLGILSKQICLELNKLDNWFAINKLSLNVTKTNFMLFGNRNKSNCIISIKNKEIERVQVTKFLGILIDENFNWKEHIKLVISKLSKSIAIILRAKKVLDSQSLLTLYCSLFLPYLSYCAEIWGNTYKSNILPIILLQKKVIRIITKSYFTDHTTPLFVKLHLLKFEDIVKLQTGIIMYKAKCNLLPINLQNMFKLNNLSSIETRQKNNFFQKYVRTSSKSMCISVLGVKLWNSLNSVITNSRNVKAFKYSYKKFLLSNYSS